MVKNKNSKLTKKKYWDNVHKKSFKFIKWKIFQGLQKFQFYNIVDKHINSKYKSVFEVGCAPGNYLINFYKYYGLELNGIEYSKDGINSIKNNFKQNKINGNLIYGDFFDEKIIANNKEKYDIVCSFGFIEHFDNVGDVIDKHFTLTKKNGLVIFTIPNLQYLNKLLLSKNILDSHNLNIMNKKYLKKIFENYKLLELKYVGGLFNFGLLTYKNPILDWFRFCLFIGQRVFIDPIFILLYMLGIDFSNKYTSPQIVLICKKDGKKN